MNKSALYAPDVIDLHIQSLKDCMEFYRNEINRLDLIRAGLVQKVAETAEKIAFAENEKAKTKSKFKRISELTPAKIYKCDYCHAVYYEQFNKFKHEKTCSKKPEINHAHLPTNF